MSKINLSNSKIFMDRPQKRGAKRVTQTLANAHKTTEQLLSEQQRQVLPLGVKVTRKQLVRFISTARRSPYYQHDEEEQAENDAFVASLSDSELIRNFAMFESIFCRYTLKYFLQKDDRRKKIKNLSRAAACIKMADDIKIEGKKRGINIISNIIK